MRTCLSIVNSCTSSLTMSLLNMSANAGIEGLKLHKEVDLYFQAREKNGFSAIYSNFTLEDARNLSLNLSKCLAGSTEFDGTEWEVIVPSCHSTGGIPISVYKPSVLRTNPSILVYFHGGGYVLGSRKSCEVACKAIAREANCIVLNVEYRLAPEYKIPACNEDAAEVVTWVLANKQPVGGSVESTVGVGGDSAGGQITADVCHDIKGISYQVLIYPKVDKRLDRASANEFKDGPVIPASMLQWFVGLGYEKDYKGVKGLPMARENFTDLPPALFIIAECDPLRDDSYDYEKKLQEAGVETHTLLMNGLVHSFFSLPGIFKESTMEAYRRIADFIQLFPMKM